MAKVYNSDGEYLGRSGYDAGGADTGIQDPANVNRGPQLLLPNGSPLTDEYMRSVVGAGYWDGASEEAKQRLRVMYATPESAQAYKAAGGNVPADVSAGAARAMPGPTAPGLPAPPTPNYGNGQQQPGAAANVSGTPPRPTTSSGGQSVVSVNPATTPSTNPFGPNYGNDLDAPSTVSNAPDPAPFNYGEDAGESGTTTSGLTAGGSREVPIGYRVDPATGKPLRPEDVGRTTTVYDTPPQQPPADYRGVPVGDTKPVVTDPKTGLPPTNEPRLVTDTAADPYYAPVHTAASAGAPTGGNGTGAGSSGWGNGSPWSSGWAGTSLANKGPGEDIWDSNSKALTAWANDPTTANTARSAWGDVLGDASKAYDPTATKSAWAASKGFFTDQETGNERSASDLFSQMPGKYASDFNDARRSLDNADATRTSFDRNRGFFNANPVGNEYNNYFSYLRDKSRSERAFDDGTAENSLNNYYNRQQELATNQTNKALAARGLFNTGAAVRSLEEQNRGIEANKSKDWLGLMSQADDQAIARANQAGQWQTAISNDQLKRKDLERGWATAADTTDINRAAGYGDIAATSADIDSTAAKGMLGVDDARSRRLATGIDAGAKVDTTTADLMSKRVDTTGKAISGLNDADNIFANRVKSMLDMSEVPFGQMRDRITTASNMYKDATAQQAGMFSDSWNAALGTDAALAQEDINAILASGRVSAEGAQAIRNMMTGSFNNVAMIALLRKEGIDPPAWLTKTK